MAMAMVLGFPASRVFRSEEERETLTGFYAAMGERYPSESPEEIWGRASLHADLAAILRRRVPPRAAQ